MRRHKDNTCAARCSRRTDRQGFSACWTGRAYIHPSQRTDRQGFFACWNGRAYIHLFSTVEQLTVSLDDFHFDYYDDGNYCCHRIILNLIDSTRETMASRNSRRIYTRAKGQLETKELLTPGQVYGRDSSMAGKK